MTASAYTMAGPTSNNGSHGHHAPTGRRCHYCMLYNVFIICTNYYFNYICLRDAWPLPSATAVTLSDGSVTPGGVIRLDVF